MARPASAYSQACGRRRGKSHGSVVYRRFSGGCAESFVPFQTTSMTASSFIKPGNRLTILLVTIFAAVVLLLTRVDWLTLGLGPYCIF